MYRALIARIKKARVMRQARALLLSLAMGGLFSGCSEDPVVVWQSTVKSPDGLSVAVAKTMQYSGPGNAAVITSVDIMRADGKGKSVEILVFEDPLEANLSAIRVEMSWKKMGRLDIVYPKKAELSFRADLLGETMIVSRSAP